MTPINREDILKKAKEISDNISKQEEVREFKTAEKLIKDHKKIQGLITKIKLKQQELVNAKHYKKTNYISMLEAELDELNEELHEIPLVQQYQQNQAELNKYIQFIIRTLKGELSERIPIDKE